MTPADNAKPVSYEAFYRRSIDNPEQFWAEQAKLIHWQKPFDQVLDDSRLPFTRWFVGGETNLCYNAVDRHLQTQAAAPAVILVCTETGLGLTDAFA